MSWELSRIGGKGRSQAADMNGSSHKGDERSANNDPEWVGLPKNHEKHAGDDNRPDSTACYKGQKSVFRILIIVGYHKNR